MRARTESSPHGGYKVVAVDGSFLGEVLKLERINVTLHTDPELREARVAGVIHDGPRILVVFEHPKWPKKPLSASPEVLLELRSADV